MTQKRKDADWKDVAWPDVELDNPAIPMVHGVDLCKASMIGGMTMFDLLIRGKEEKEK